jgi:hypothetical protein
MCPSITIQFLRRLIVKGVPFFEEIKAIMLD